MFRVAGHKSLLYHIYNKPLPVVPEPVKVRSIKWGDIQDILANTNFISPTGCMEWKGAIHKATGYGVLTLDWEKWYVHRYVAFYYKIKHKGWRDFLFSRRAIHVCHTCDNPPCINPEHLLIATAQYNTWDSIVKGRRTYQQSDATNADMYTGLFKVLHTN